MDFLFFFERKRMTVEELLAREYDPGVRVTNCILHMNLELDKRPDDCILCLYDLRNQLSYAISVNNWLNEWKHEATVLLQKEEKKGG
jgi:hypothetical protein